MSMRTIDELENLEDATSDFIYYTKGDDTSIILPNLENVQETSSIVLDSVFYTTYMDKIIIDVSQNNILKSINHFNLSQSVCFFTSDQYSDYFIKIDFNQHIYSIPLKFRSMLEYCKGIQERQEGFIRFYIIPITLIFKGGSHANVIIIDNLSMTIEFFEPHGVKYRGQYHDIYDMEHHIKNVLKDIFPKHYQTYKYVNTQTCVKGLQIIQETGKNGQGGFCAAWSLLIIHMRLLNIYLETTDVIKFFMENFNSTELDRYIKRYASYIEKHTAMINAKFNRNLLYPMEFDEKDVITPDRNEYNRIGDRIDILTQEFIDNIDGNKDERNKILNELFSYVKFTQFNDIFTEVISTYIKSNYKKKTSNVDASTNFDVPDNSVSSGTDSDIGSDSDSSDNTISSDSSDNTISSDSSDNTVSSDSSDNTVSSDSSETESIQSDNTEMDELEDLMMLDV